MVTSRASRITLGTVVLGVGIAIAVVHNMQTEERKRLHEGVIRDKAVLAAKEKRMQGALLSDRKKAT